MEEENQQQATTKEPKQVKQEQQRVTTKDPKKVKAGKRMAAINHKKREEQVQLEKIASRVNQYYGFGAILALGAIGGLGYYIYRSKKGEVPNNPPQQPRPQAISAQPPSRVQLAQTNKFEMD